MKSKNDLTKTRRTKGVLHTDDNRDEVTQTVVGMVNIFGSKDPWWGL